MTPWLTANSMKQYGKLFSRRIDLATTSICLTAFSAWDAERLSSGEVYSGRTPRSDIIAFHALLLIPHSPALSNLNDWTIGKPRSANKGFRRALTIQSRTNPSDSSR